MGLGGFRYFVIPVVKCLAGCYMNFRISGVLQYMARAPGRMTRRSEGLGGFLVFRVFVGLADALIGCGGASDSQGLVVGRT